MRNDRSRHVADEIAKVIESAAPADDATQPWIASWAKSKKQ